GGGYRGQLGQCGRRVEVVVQRGLDGEWDSRSRDDPGGQQCVDIAQGAVEPVERPHALLDQRVRPVQWLAVVRRQQRVAQRLRRVRAYQVVHFLDVAERLAHLGAATVEHAVVQPPARER